jgi:ribonuclease-3
MSRKADTKPQSPESPPKPGAAPKGAAKRPPKSVRRVAAATTALEKTIGYRFSDAELLERALTEMLYAAFPKADEGELSRRLADLVRRETCADVARVVDLGASLRLGASESRTGGRTRSAILADVCESLIGAIFLDGGYKAALAFVERFWAERMRKPARPLRDPKTVLQEWAQARGLPTPSYREIERIGPHHDPEFRVAVVLPERAPAEGRGRSKRAAEQAAASELLSREGVRADG